MLEQLRLNATSAQPQRQFVPQAFFLKLSNIMFVAAAAAVPQNTFDSLYRPQERINFNRYFRSIKINQLDPDESIRSLLIDLVLINWFDPINWFNPD